MQRDRQRLISFNAVKDFIIINASKKFFGSSYVNAHIDAGNEHRIYRGPLRIGLLGTHLATCGSPKTDVSNAIFLFNSF